MAILVASSACGARTPLSDELGSDASISSSADASTDGPIADAAARDAAKACIPAGPDAGVCNVLSASGPPVVVVCDPSPPPAPTGGVVVDGTYVLASSRFHGPCAAPESDRIAWVACGSRWSTIQESTVGGITTTQHIDGDVVTRGTLLELMPTCGRPDVSRVTFDFDATPTTLTLYVHGFGAGTVRVDVFVRQ